MVKAYLRYRCDSLFGCIASEKCNAAFCSRKNLIAAGHEDCVSVWSSGEGRIKYRLDESRSGAHTDASTVGGGRGVPTHYATYICFCKNDNNQVAVGYSDGSIKIWKIKQNEVRVTFRGHKTPVNTLDWNLSGSLLLSGGLDSDIVVWSVVNESGVCRLKGHKDAVTHAMFLCANYSLFFNQRYKNERSLAIKSGDEDDILSLYNKQNDINISTYTNNSNDDENNNYIISCSKDGSVRIWDVCTQNAVQVIFDFHTNVWTFAVHPNGRRLLVGASDHLIRVYELYVPNVSLLSFSSSFSSSEFIEKNQPIDVHTGLPIYAFYLGSISLPSGKQRITSLVFCLEKINEEDIFDNEKFEYQDNLKQSKKRLLNCNDEYMQNSETEENENSNVTKKKKKKNAAQLSESAPKNEEKDEEEEEADEDKKNSNLDVWENGLLLCVSSNKMKIEVFKVNNIAEQKRRKKRRIKRLREKLQKKQKKIEEMKKVFDSLGKKEKKGKGEVGGDDYEIEQLKKEEKEIQEQIDTVILSLDKLAKCSSSSFLVNERNNTQGNIKAEENAEGSPSASSSSSSSSTSSLSSSVADEYTHITSVVVPCKIRSVDLHREEKNAFYLLIHYANNQIEVRRIPLLKLIQKKKKKNQEMEDGEKLEKGEKEEEEEEEEEKFIKDSCIEKEGHRNTICHLNISPDDSLILSISNDSVKVWNSTTLNCVKSMEISDCTCGYFIAGNEQILLGKKGGGLELFNIEKLEQSFSMQPFQNDVLAIAIHPKLDKFAALSAESSIKFFELFVVAKEKKKKIKKNKNKNENDEEEESISLTEKNVEFKMLAERPLAEKGVDLQYSPDGKYIVTSLLDNTMQILYVDTMKLFLTLYGHKLPVCTLHISSDSTLLASGSADKSIKLWGMDFGNLHHSFRAHNETVSKVRWVRNTHYLVSIGHDGMVEMWDMDSYELICKHAGHHSQLLSLALSFDAAFFITAGNGKSMRIWRRTDEQLFIEEERERELEEEFEKDILREDIYDNNFNKSNIIVQSARPTVKTIETVKNTEKLMEVIDEAEEAYNIECEYNKSLEEYEKNLKEFADNKEMLDIMQPPVKRPMPVKLAYLNMTPHEYLLHSVASLTSNTMYEVLIALPFSYAEKLLKFIVTYLEALAEINCLDGMGDEKNKTKDMITCPVENICKSALILVQLHFRQFISSSCHRPLMVLLSKYLRPLLNLERERMSFNTSALGFILRDIRSQKTVDEFFNKHGKTKKKNKNANFPLPSVSNKRNKTDHLPE